MGHFYSNVTLRGPVQSQITGACEALHLQAFVSATVDELTVVCEQASDLQGDDWAQAAQKLSASLNCPALAVLNHDDDILVYELYSSGRLIDEYNSQPGYFEDDEEETPPSGGNSKILCGAFGMPGNEKEVTHALRGVDFLFAVERHQALLKALQCPALPYEFGYNYVKKDGEPGEWHAVLSGVA